MKIFVFTATRFPEGMAATKRIYCYAKGWKAAGIDTEVLICRNVGADDGRMSYEGRKGDLTYKYIVNQKYSNLSLKRKIDWFFLDFFCCIPYIWKHLKRNDIAYVYIYNNILQIILITIAKIKGAKLVRETCEHPSTLGGAGKIKALYRWIEYHLLFPKYDVFIPISRELDNFVKKYKSKKAQTLIVPILVEDNGTIDVSQKASLYDVPYIIHTGTMLEQKDSISIILKAFAKYKETNNDKLRLVFTGQHANDKCSYIPTIKKLGIEKWVDLRGLVSEEEVTILQHYAAMSIVYKSDNLQTRNCFPTKLGEVLMGGIPVITTNVGDADLYLKNRENAIIVKDGSIEELCDSIVYLMTNPAVAKSIGEKGTLIAKMYFNPISQGKRMVELFKKM